MWFIETARQRLGIDDLGRVCWLAGAAAINRVAGRPVPLVRLCMIEGGRKVLLMPRGAPAVRSGEDRLDLCWTTFSAPGGTAVSVMCEVSVQAEGEGFVWSLRLESGVPVAEALFPVIGGLRGEALYFPHRAGERILDPARVLVSERYRSFASCPTTRTEDGAYGREITYCGQASMAWLELDASPGGTYLGSHDPRFGLAGLRVETDGQDLTLALRRYGPSGAGVWETPPAILAPHDGDWRTGARIYRDWIHRLLPRPQQCAVAEGHAAVCPEWDLKKDGAVRHTFAEIPALDELASRMGIDHLVLGGWQRGGRSPEYYPDMDLGTMSDLAEGIAHVRERGHLVTLHVDARRFDTASEYYATLGSRWAAKNEFGWPCVEQEGATRYAVMCPGHDEWRHHLIDAARWLVRSTGCQGLYLGQVGSGTPCPCYDPAHRHRTAGEHNWGFIHILDELKPEATLLIENCGDVYSSRAWASFCWNGEGYDEFFALYRYTFPEHRMINAVQPRRTSDGASRERIFYRDLERAWLLGSLFWASPHEGFGPGDDRLLAHLARVTALRRAADPYLAAARYRDTEGLVADGAKVTRFDGLGYLALAVSNPLGVPGHVLVPEAPASVTCMELGREVERPWSKDGRRILLPTAPLSLLVLRT